MTLPRWRSVEADADVDAVDADVAARLLRKQEPRFVDGEDAPFEGDDEIRRSRRRTCEVASLSSRGRGR